MFYKKTECYLIIFYLLTQITMNLSAKLIPTNSDIRLFTKQLINLTQHTGQDRYRGPDTSMHKRPSHVRIQCQMSDNIKFQIAPSADSYQLVALVPQLGSESDKGMPDIIYNIVDPMVENGTLYRTPWRNYTLWSAILEEGSPVKWRGGEKVPEYHTSTEYRTYKIKVFQSPSVDRSAVDGKFTWNTTGDRDSCFEVENSCQKSKYTKVWLNSKDDEPQIMFDHLRADDKCKITVTGWYGRTHLTYRTLPWKKLKRHQTLIERFVTFQFFPRK